jgi:hypothetical protein
MTQEKWVPVFPKRSCSKTKKRAGASAGLAGRSNGELNLQRTKTMTIEIVYLAAQLQRWLNQRVARHLEAQAAKFNR